MTNGTNNAAKTMTVGRGFSTFHVWSRTWPQPHRAYCGIVNAKDEYEAGQFARLAWGHGRVYDVQSGKFGPIVRKGA